MKSALYCHYKVFPLIIRNVGPYIQFSLQKRQATLRIDEQVEVKPVFEYIHDKGEINVILQECYHTAVSELLQAQIDNIKEELSVQIHECGVTNDIDNVRIIIGAGGIIKHILMPDQYRTVVIKTSDTDDYQFTEKLHEQLSTYGSIEKFDHKMFKREQALFVTFHHPEDAMKSIQMILSENATIEPRMFKTQSGQQFSLQLEWNRRQKD